MELLKAIDRQRKIYIDGIAGYKPRVPFDSKNLFEKAKNFMSNEAWAYVIGGASDENTASRNRSKLDALTLLPRMMRDNSEFDFSSEIFGTHLPFPFLLAPIGALDMVVRQADIKIAKACAATGTPNIFSNQAGEAMEDSAAVMGDTGRWFQLYWSKSDDLVLSLVKRAEDSGCKAIVLTVDTTMLGWRPRDLELGYLPFLKGYGIGQYTSDPVFNGYVKNGWDGADQSKVKPKISLDTLRHVFELKSNFKGTLKEAMASVQLFTQIYTNPALTWEKVSWLKTKTNLPVIIKGILHPEDALLAKESGADGIIVSNHGGRQVDGAVSTIEMLPEIRKVLPKPFKVLMDSGIRTGADMVKVIALGADAVLLGRPYVYGLAIAGQQGVEEVIRNFQNDFELTARLTGLRKLDEIDESCLNL